jgi:hypothetical protein
MDEAVHSISTIHQQNTLEGYGMQKAPGLWGSSLADVEERSEADLRVPDCAVRSIVQSHGARCKREVDLLECTIGTI